MAATAEQAGGVVICRPKPIEYKLGSSQAFTLMSDLHIGANNVDYKLIDRELKIAKEHGDRILIDGDVFDMILTKDMEKFEPDAIHPRLRGCRDVINQSLNWACEIFAPYANIIDMVGTGNHDNWASKHHSVDVVKLLVEKLEKDTKKDHLIHYGGYTGFVDYRFRYKNKPGDERGHGKRYLIYYHHGYGGDSSSNKGVTDLGKKMWADADVIWLGHKHHKVSVVVQTMKCPQSGINPIMREVRQIMTGAYFDTYSGQSQENIRKKGRKANYAADWGVEPQGKGGVRLVLTFDSLEKPPTIRVIQ